MVSPGFITGLLKKVVIADAAGKTAAVFLKSNFSELSVLGAWLGIIMYTLQIYFDFSGYSDMSIGLGRIFGFTYKENFNYPYIAKSVQDFWRRWHISLGNFFRDYVYIPLGGNRKHFIRNVMAVWLLTGLWHGASYNFIFWGLYYGILLLIERTVFSNLIKKLPALAAHIYLSVIVIVGWVFFYFSNLSQGLDFVKILFGVGKNPLYDIKFEVQFFNNIIFLTIAAAACTPVFKNAMNIINAHCTERHMPCYLLEPILNAAGLIIATIMLVGQTYTPFLYFEF